MGGILLGEYGRMNSGLTITITELQFWLSITYISVPLILQRSVTSLGSPPLNDSRWQTGGSV